MLAITHRLESEGRSTEAWELINDVLRTSRHIGNRGCVIERLTGVALGAVLTDRIGTWSSDPKLTTSELRKALSDLSKTWESTPKTSEILKTEYNVLFKLYDLIDAGDPGDEFFEPSHGLVRYAPFRYVVAEPERARRVVNLFFRNKLKYCDAPRWERPPVAGKFNLYDDSDVFQTGSATFSIEEFDRMASRSALGSMLFPAVPQLLDALDRDAASFRCALCILAGQAYFREHGHFPASLEELVPGYLSEIPLDPFDGNPLKYRVLDQSAVVYSVYVDWQDNGGNIEWLVRPQKDRDAPQDFGYRLIPPGSRPLVAPKPPVVEVAPDPWDAP